MGSNLGLLPFVCMFMVTGAHTALRDGATEPGPVLPGDPSLHRLGARGHNLPNHSELTGSSGPSQDSTAKSHLSQQILMSKGDLNQHHKDASASAHL